MNNTWAMSIYWGGIFAQSSIHCNTLRYCGILEGKCTNFRKCSWEGIFILFPIWLHRNIIDYPYKQEKNISSEDVCLYHWNLWGMACINCFVSLIKHARKNMGFLGKEKIPHNYIVCQFLPLEGASSTLKYLKYVY